MKVFGLFKRNKDLVLAGAMALSGLTSIGVGMYQGRLAVIADSKEEREAHRMKADATMIAGAFLFTAGNLFGMVRLAKTTNPEAICTPG